MTSFCKYMMIRTPPSCPKETVQELGGGWAVSRGGRNFFGTPPLRLPGGLGDSFPTLDARPASHKIVAANCAAVRDTRPVRKEDIPMSQSFSRYLHPFEAVHHPLLEPEVKQAILAAWASGRNGGEVHRGRRRSRDIHEQALTKETASRLPSRKGRSGQRVMQ